MSCVVSAAVADVTLGVIAYSFGSSEDAAIRRYVVLEQSAAVDALEKGDTVTLDGTAYEIARINARASVPEHKSLFCGSEYTCLQLTADYAGTFVNGSFPTVRAFEGESAGAAFSYAVENLVAGVAYYFRVTAVSTPYGAFPAIDGYDGQLRSPSSFVGQIGRASCRERV